MEAPDKIYVNPDLDCLWTDECPGDVEYIRKDTLLKWINEARAIPHENTIARDLAFQEVINKLNEM